MYRDVFLNELDKQSHQFNLFSDLEPNISSQHIPMLGVKSVSIRDDNENESRVSKLLRVNCSDYVLIRKCEFLRLLI